MRPKPFEIIVKFTPQSTKTGITYKVHQNGSLIRCKDCRWFVRKECSFFCLSSAHEETFCSYAEPKDTTEEVRKQLKDMEQRREMDRKK